MKTKTIEPKKLIYKLRDLREGFPRTRVLERNMPEYVAELEGAQKKARKFGQKHIEPVALELDKKMEYDHDYFPWDIVRAGLPYRFLSAIVPKAFGGVGYLTAHMAVMVEEMCSFCPGIANIFGAHALGLAPILMAPDIRMYERYMRQVTEAEKKGKPLLFALAITESAAGSDMEDADFLRTARLVTTARKVKGGYVLNGRKVFISNGSVARYIWVAAVLDRERPVETSVSFVIPDDAKGFSVGTIEKKLGQRACPAAELVFDDVFVPEEDRLGDIGEAERLTALVLGGSRAPVAAIATGIARGAFERLLKYLNETRVRGRWLFEEQWVQMALVDMLGKIQAARQLFLDASMACDFFGVPKLMRHPSMKFLNGLPQPVLKTRAMHRSFTSRRMYDFVRGLVDRHVEDSDINLIAAYSSIAKYRASDLAVEVCSRAMDIMGPDGAAVEYGVEKALRDAKLTQIYEGTNQINRLYVYKQSLV
ncbi:MAG: acyl-CoA dehydrogenase family protein [bacterium]